MIVIVSQIATTLAITGLLIYTLTSGLSLIAIYTTTSILSLTSMFSGIAFTSSITGLIDQPRIQKATAMNQMAISFAAIGSPAVGGLLYGTVSIPVFLIIFILASIIAVILESTMNFRLFAVVNKIEEQKETMWQSMKAGIRYLRVQSTILVILWISLLINFFFGAFEVGYSYILIENLKMQSQHFGFTQGAFSLGMLLMSVYFSARKEVKFPLIVSKRGIVGLGAIIGFIALPLLLPMVYWTMFGYYLVLMFCFGILIITVNTPLHVMFQKTIDDDYKGRVFSIVETMSMALTPLGMVIYGVLYDIFPAQWVLLLSAAMLIIITVSMMRTSVIRKVHPEWKGKQVVYKVKARSVAR